jgi:hypothetical protein
VLGTQLHELGSSGHVTAQLLADTRNATLILEGGGPPLGPWRSPWTVPAVALALAVALIW